MRIISVFVNLLGETPLPLWLYRVKRAGEHKQIGGQPILREEDWAGQKSLIAGDSCLGVKEKLIMER